MWDGGVNNMEMQPIVPIISHVEMDEDLGNILLKLQRNKTYVALFKEAFGDTLINSRNMLHALAQFTGLMISSNSRYDKLIRHEDNLSAMEK